MAAKNPRGTLLAYRCPTGSPRYHDPRLLSSSPHCVGIIAFAVAGRFGPICRPLGCHTAIMTLAAVWELLSLRLKAKGIGHDPEDMTRSSAEIMLEQ